MRLLTLLPCRLFPFVRVSFVSRGGWWWSVLSSAGCGMELPCCCRRCCVQWWLGGSNGGRGWLLVAEVTEGMWVVTMMVVVEKQKVCLSIVFISAVLGKRRLRSSV